MSTFIPPETVMAMEFVIDSHMIDERTTLLTLAEQEGFSKELTDVLIATLRAACVRGIVVGVSRREDILKQFDSLGINLSNVSS